MKAAAAITKSFINLVYPIRCMVCVKDLDAFDELHVCNSCIGKIKRNSKPPCKRLYFEKAYSGYLYEDPLRELIHLFKYKSKISLSKILSNLMINYIKEYPEVLDGIDMISYVPLQNNRLRRRGFNQSRVLAVKVSVEFGIPFADALEKTRATRPQNELSREKRLINLKDAFKVRDAKISNKNILLIDDVMTTGATLDECSRTLLESGVKSVRCLTLARGV